MSSIEQPLITCFECGTLFRRNTLYQPPHPYVKGENICNPCREALEKRTEHDNRN